MLTRLKLRGFKSFVQTDLELAKLTILTGLNSSGKSSVFQSLQMASKAFKSSDSLMLEGHGSLREIKNSYVRESIQISVEDLEGKKFEVQLYDDDKRSKNYGNNFDLNFVFPEIVYISASRFGPKSSIPIYNDNFKKNRVGPNGENILQFIKYYSDSILDERIKHPNSEGQTLEYNLRGWLNEISPNVKFTFNIDNSSDTSYSLFNGYRSANVGFGLSYSLTIIAALLISTVQENTVLIIENPEAHLHPKGQVGIANLIAKCAQYGKSQIIVETHSDHIFDTLRVNCKEGDGLSDMIQIHWFELDRDGNTFVQSPNIDSDGRVDKWPEGLFDQFAINASKLM